MLTNFTAKDIDGAKCYKLFEGKNNGHTCDINCKFIGDSNITELHNLKDYHIKSKNGTVKTVNIYIIPNIQEESRGGTNKYALHIIKEKKPESNFSP